MSRLSDLLDWFLWHWKAVTAAVLLVGFVAMANWPANDDPPRIEAFPISIVPTTTVPPSTTTTLSTEALEELEESWQKVWAEMRESGVLTRTYAANQYGCHADGRCLDDNDVWCDKEDYIYTDNRWGDWFCYWDPQP